MSEVIQIQVHDEVHQVPKGITLEELSKKYQRKSRAQIVAANFNNKMRELSYAIEDEGRVDFIDLSMDDGIRIYIRGLTFIFIWACRQLFPGCRVTIEHSMGKGLYCEVHGDIVLTYRQVYRIKQKMQEIIEQDLRFERFEVPISEAKEIFKDLGFNDKLDILKYRPEDTVHLYRCGDMINYLYGYMVPSTGYLSIFDLKFYLPGVIIRYPSKYLPNSIPEFEDSPRLSKVFREAEQWGKRIHIENTAQLNQLIENGRGNEIIRICEANQEKHIARIADEIAQQKDRIRLILIAGPSASGKTTFAQRLRIHLMVNGLVPVSLSMDNYFINRDEIPLDENGERDLESIDIIDLELFNEHMARLIQGQEVELPYFNFQKGQREYLGHRIKIGKDQPIIVEGIHGLNEKLTSMIPKSNKFKIYISALTQLNIDDHNRIPTTDTRLIRRAVRDYQFRGASLEETLKMWASVRRGEEKYIFPFQEQADVMLNSALVYELSVLKPYIVPLLGHIDEESPYYSEANRLRKFMKYFTVLDPEEVPSTSIIREFIGGSCFE